MHFLFSMPCGLYRPHPFYRSTDIKCWWDCACSSQVIPYSRKFSRYKILRIHPDPRKQRKLIPSKISRYTVLMQDEIPDTGDIFSSETESESDSEEDVKLSSSPNVITVSCCENVADVSIQTDTSCCDKVLQKLEVLDGLNHLQDELCTQSCDLMDVRNRCFLIEKQVDRMEQHAHVSYLIGQHINVMILCTFLHVRLQSSGSSGTTRRVSFRGVREGSFAPPPPPLRVATIHTCNTYTSKRFKW